MVLSSSPGERKQLIISNFLEKPKRQILFSLSLLEMQELFRLLAFVLLQGSVVKSNSTRFPSSSSLENPSRSCTDVPPPKTPPPLSSCCCCPLLLLCPLNPPIRSFAIQVVSQPPRISPSSSPGGSNSHVFTRKRGILFFFLHLEGKKASLPFLCKFFFSKRRRMEVGS